MRLQTLAGCRHNRNCNPHGESDLAIVLEQCEGANAIHLEGVIDIALASELKTTLVEALKSSKPLRLALNADTDLDVTAIQLLWAAEREAKASNVDFLLEGSVPDSVSKTLKEAGFERFPVPV
jgi:anti-anti-sigma regulatory factor